MQTDQLAHPASSAGLDAKLEQIAAAMQAAGDQDNTQKTKQLAEKAKKAEISIAFCGHFSAGKSTMINTLLGKDLLPSNPIPTSANVVKIRGGEKAVQVHTRHHGVLTFDPDTDMEQVKQYAIDGDTVEWVEIAYPGTFLDERSSLLDTPGIDSTDAAHKIATESALHLADAVIYMMDYNHVQAEENFNFTKTLKDRGKPVYLVINMIDKHLDFELDFDSYKESVQDAFATWNIQPDGIFYTSLAEPDHPENQYEDFRRKLQSLLEQREVLLADSLTHSAEYLIEQHVRFLQKQNAEKRQQLESNLEQEISGLEPTDAAQVALAKQEMETALAAETERFKTAKDSMEQQLSSLLENARLTYYSTNEAAEQYLESRKPGFKVGLLFAAKKTEEERARRLEALLRDFREKVSANLDFHFKDLLGKFPQQYGIRDEAYHAEVHEAKVEITGEFLAAQVKEGAGTREYVMNYCADIAKAVKQEYRRLGLALIDKLLARLEAQFAAEHGKREERLQALDKLAETHRQLALLEQTEQQAGSRLLAILREGA
ncbi:hypothetical protein GCM10023228_23890 [Brevibacillus fulvus]|uniref:Small GTP-binding protein n=1 Tax=Brevibacillus fulvus TaxID=1125967 RepID=A0A938XYV1_9BACL|nr:small GTP-binding protein [Brevibacillus fulvus]